ncbi:MAG: hypothetical protein DMF67_14340 [Acidobacteria bacterium]|nr:MAG: hypothetical protein DMF67_14340 [Acidobacteriota bacterium]
MENVERTEFVVLTGHLDDQPLPDLIRRLRVLRKSGRLQVEYPEGPGSFFFEDGQLVDAQLGSLRGVEALYAALSLDGASFNFNPLVRPPERSIDRQGQKFVWDLIESPRREGLAEIKASGGEPGTAAAPTLPQNAPRQLPPAAELMAPLEERLKAVEEAIISTSHRFSRERLLYAVIIGFLSGLSLIITLDIIFAPSRPRPAAAAGGAALPRQEPGAANGAAGVAAAGPSHKPAGKNEEGDAGPAAGERAGLTQVSNSNEKAQTQAAQAQAPVPSTAAVIGTRRDTGVPAARREYVVQVLVEVKNGRVTDARVWNPRPGADAYEAVALRMARERRYPEDFNGGERLKIRVKL